jgi:putative spermidine/putrescine transport system ATP-binding protein
MTFLTLERLGKQYGNSLAVETISLTVERGEFVSLLGPSGCGKITTLQMIAGLVTPTTGSIILDGRDITHEAVNRRGLGIVFQSYALFPHMTVAQNVAFGLEMRGIGRAERDKRVADILALVQLSAMAARYPRQLSGGQRQRVAIARALVIRPPILLLDEPLSNLDAKLREEMQFELARIQRQVGTTTIMVTHDQAEALSISDRVVVMARGRIVQADAPFQLYERPATSAISSFVGRMNRLEGGWRAGRAVVAGIAMPCEAALRPDGAVSLFIRPEKILLAGVGGGVVDGWVTSRFFFGSHWLYRIDTAVGALTVSVPNQGLKLEDVGDAVGLKWPPDSLRHGGGISGAEIV